MRALTGSIPWAAADELSNARAAQPIPCKLLNAARCACYDDTSARPTQNCNTMLKYVLSLAQTCGETKYIIALRNKAPSWQLDFVGSLRRLANRQADDVMLACLSACLYAISVRPRRHHYDSQHHSTRLVENVPWAWRYRRARLFPGLRACMPIY